MHKIVNDNIVNWKAKKNVKITIKKMKNKEKAWMTNLENDLHKLNRGYYL